MMPGFNEVNQSIHANEEKTNDQKPSFFFFGIYRINEDTMLIGKLFEHIVRMQTLQDDVLMKA